MKYTRRPYRGAEDLPLPVECRRRCTTPENCGDYPGVSDLYELLDTSGGTSASLWENSAVQVVAFAIVHLPYCNLYFFLLPKIHDRELEADIIRWGLVRASEFAREQGEQIALDTACRDSDSARLAMLALHGFTEQGNQTLHMERYLREALPEFQMPEGFTLRNVEGTREVEEYVALHQDVFETQNMTVEHRLSTMNSPDYRPELDLVAVAPGGTFAAFCYCTIDAEANALCGRNAGAIGTVGTRPQFRQRGLGRAMALAGMRRLQGLGIEVAWLTTGSWNANAQRVFKSLGFRTTYSILWFSKST